MPPILLLLLGCAPDAVAWPVPHIFVAPDELVFERAGVGVVAIATLAVENTGTAPVTLRAAVDDPFDLAVSTLIVAPGATVGLQVAVAPTGWDALRAELRLTGELTDVTVGVTAVPLADYDLDGADALGAGGDDCDDLRASVAPGLLEVCDGLDNDCDGTADVDAADALGWYPDADGDGWGALVEPVAACSSPEPGWTPNAGDCDESDDDVNPAAAEEWYDGVDGDCSGGSDFDQDGDGHEQAPLGGDCVDENATISPDAAEIPGNNVDEDCDGTTA